MVASMFIVVFLSIDLADVAARAATPKGRHHSECVRSRHDQHRNGRRLQKLKPDLVPVGRFGTVEEVADVALMLARNGFITEQTININGGRYLS